MIKFLEHDIADKKFIEIIRKFLKAGIMEDGKYLDSEQGTPQGNGASPVLANFFGRNGAVIYIDYTVFALE